MDEGDVKGIMYLKCILESYADTSQDWKSLKKIKLDVTLQSTISKLASDDYIQFRYKEKDTTLKLRLSNLKKSNH